MSIGFDEELHPYEEPKQDINDVVLLGNWCLSCVRCVSSAARHPVSLSCEVTLHAVVSSS